MVSGDPRFWRHVGKRLSMSPRISSSTDGCPTCRRRRSHRRGNVARGRLGGGLAAYRQGVPRPQPRRDLPKTSSSMALSIRPTSRTAGKEGRLAPPHLPPPPAAAPRVSPARNVLMYLRTGSAGPTQPAARIVGRRRLGGLRELLVINLRRTPPAPEPCAAPGAWHSGR